MKKPTLFIFLLFVSLAFAHESDMIYNSSTVSEIRITMDPAVLNWVYSNVDSDSLHPVSVTFHNENTDLALDSVGFRIRGNTSRNSAKKSFKLDFNEFIQGQSICGIQKFNLKAEQNDPSIIRSKFAFELFRRIGLAGNRIAYTQVFINNSYYGLYENTEHVDEKFLAYHMQNSSGNLWKCLYPADLTYRGPNASDYFPYTNGTRPYELKTNEDLYDYSQLTKLIDRLNNTPASLKKDSMESILYVTEVIKYFAVNIMTGSWDDYRYLTNNYYLYHEPSADKFHFIPYDYDNTFGIDWVEGSNWGDPNWTRIDMYDYPAINNSGRPLADLIFDDPEYRNLFSHFMDFYTHHVFQESSWRSYGDSIKALIRPYVANDTYYPRDHGFSMDDFDNSYDTDFRKNHVERGLYEFMRKRTQQTEEDLSWQVSQPAIYAHSLSYLPQDSLEITISAFDANGLKNIFCSFYDINGSSVSEKNFMRDPICNTYLVEEADRWTLRCHMPENACKYILSAEDSSNMTAVFPRHGYEDLRSKDPNSLPLYINEIMASNSSTAADPAGEFDDWIEIFNGSDSNMDLGGMFLSDKADNPAKWSFPAGTEIAAGSFLVIYCDEDNDQSGLHSNFKLSAKGEFISLTDTDSLTVIDSLSFTEQSTDISYGRHEDGSSSWEYFTAPTPGYSNLATPIAHLSIPTAPTLYSCFPNPFNPETSIKFFLPEAENVDVSIYDISGKHVTTLLNSPCSAGSHTLRFKPENLGSGVYLCILKNSQQIIGSEKLIYIK